MPPDAEVQALLSGNPLLRDANDRPRGTDPDDFEIGAEVEVDDDDDDISATGDAETPRRRKKRNRYGEMARENERLREQAQQDRERIARLEGIASSYPSPQELVARAQPQVTEDPDTAALKENYERQEALLLQYEASKEDMTPEQARSFRDRARGLQEEASGIVARRAARAAAPDPRQTAAHAIRARLQANNADVYGNQNALMYARGVYQQLLAEGHPDSEQLHDLAMDRARSKFGMQRRDPRPPSEGTRTRHAGQPRVGSGRPTSGGGKPRIRMTTEMKEMADIVLGHIKDPRERYQKWANGPGKRHLQDVAEGLVDS